MTTHYISDEHLDALCDPGVSHDVKTMIALEIRNGLVIDTTPIIPPNTPDTTYAQMILLRRLYRWMQYNDNPECMDYQTWHKHREAYHIVETKLEEIERELVPGIYTDRFNGCGSTEYLQYFINRIGGNK